MHKHILILPILILSITFASAADIAYILEDSSSVSPTITSALNDLSLNYDIIRDSQIQSTDFSQYSVLLVTEDVTRRASIPFTTHSALFLDKKIADTVWNIGSTGSSSSNKIEIESEASPFFSGVFVPANDEVQIYSPSGSIHYLNFPLQSNIQVEAIKTNANRPIIASSTSNSDIKNVFIGLPDSDNWNSNTILIFKNSLSWLIESSTSNLPPEFTGPTQISWSKDSTKTINLNDFFTDPESDPLTFAVDSTSGGTDITLNQVNNIITFSSTSGWTGTDWIIFSASDPHHTTLSDQIDLIVSDINVPPTITSPSPSSSVVNLLPSASQTFQIQVTDPDSTPTIEWFVNNAKQSSTSNQFTFSQSSTGTYQVKVEVSDEESTVSKTWTVIVASSSDSTPTETSFEDANACETLSNDVDVEIESPDPDEDVEIGESLRVRIEVKNDIDEDQDFNIEVHLFNLDTNNSEDKIETDLALDGLESDLISLDFDIPTDLDASESYALFVMAEDKSCNQDHVPIDIKRPADEVIISSFDIPSSAQCGDIVTARVRVENIGSQDQNVKIRIKNSKLDITEQTSAFELEKFDEDDVETKDVTFRIPTNINSGTFKIEAIVLFDGTNTVSQDLAVSCQKLLVNELERPQTPQDNATNFSNLQPSGSASLVTSILLSLTFIIIAVAVVLYIVSSRKKSFTFNFSKRSKAIPRSVKHLFQTLRQKWR
ncbi:hypothetical protein CMI47_17635 [Candidatus Pacearchaeota archaeon]|nr:hypothetical protein [Candidatus Pacearchaeota archaeon]|tara:strand:+ start:9085 stop:11232 length:2148 start_codon:yes stop_codon:yes gene_type:complete